MTAMTLMAMALQRELMARGYVSPSIADCEEILNAMYARLARQINERVLTEAEAKEMTERAT